jgi:hypothetical protein
VQAAGARLASTRLQRCGRRFCVSRHSEWAALAWLDNQPGAPMMASRALDRSQVQVFGLSLRNPLDKNRNARQIPTMNFDRYVGMASAVGIVLIWAIVAWIGIAGPIWRAYWTASPEQWLGFAGAIAGALATIAAGAAALFAAYKTLKPVKDQLNQLVKQNDHMLYDRLRKRSVDLNAETILINQVVSGCTIVDQSLQTLLASRPGPVPNGLNEFLTAVERLEEFVARLQEKRGDLWGDIPTQRLREKFVDNCLTGGAIAMRMSGAAHSTSHLTKVLIKPQTNGWDATKEVTEALGGRLALRIKVEVRNVGREIAAIERRLFGEEIST